MHGDGEMDCPECGGEGDDYYGEDWSGLYDEQEQIENIVTDDGDREQQ